MIDVAFEINGRKIKPNQLGNELEKVMLGSIADGIRKQIRNVVCPTHGTRPRIVCKGRNLENLSIEVLGCCDELAKEVQAKIK